MLLSHVKRSFFCPTKFQPRSSTSLSSPFKTFSNFKRCLHLHEYQSQSLLKQYGVNVPAGSVAATSDEAEKIAEALATPDLVVKAQILAGGRGLGQFQNGFKGGVHLCNNSQQVRNIADKMLGHRLITKQTGPEGKKVNNVLVCRRYFLRRETYLGILLDRSAQGPLIISSPQGGMDIEKVAAENPAAIFKEPVDLDKGPSPEQTKRIAQNLGFPSSLFPVVQNQLKSMYKFFVEKDATMLEINPFVETSTGEVMSVDTKINFDDNAKYRQAELFAQEDTSQLDHREEEASKYDLNYIGLDGQIGCLVNGAGLAMATLDVIKLNGGSPANFLDIGGGASAQQVTAAIGIISRDPKVKCILVNIFGGIMKCDIIALGLIAAVKQLSLKIPLVVRLQGTNVNAAKQIMADSGLRILSADDLEEAAQKSVRVAQIMELAEQSHINVSFELPL